MPRPVANMFSERLCKSLYGAYSLGGLDDTLTSQLSVNNLIEVNAMPEVVRNLLSGVALVGVLFTPRQYEDINSVFNVDDLENIRQDVHVVAQDMKAAAEKVESERTTPKATA